MFRKLLLVAGISVCASSTLIMTYTLWTVTPPSPFPLSQAKAEQTCPRNSAELTTAHDSSGSYQVYICGDGSRIDAFE